MTVAASPAFGNRLKMLREAAGLSQNELGRRAELSGQAVSLIEKGEREPGWQTVLSLARALGVPVTSFVTEESEAPAMPIPEPHPRPLGKRK